MRILKTLCHTTQACLSSFTLALLLIGCASHKPDPEQAVAAQKAGIAAELQKSMAGWNVGDLEAFLSIYAETATFAAQDRILRGKPAIRQLYAPAFGAGAARDALAFEHLEVELIPPEAALVKGIYTNTRDGKVTRRGTTSLLMRRVEGQWRIIHDHSS